MIIVYIMGGIGNQLFQYAVARHLAHKHHTELKFVNSWYNEAKQMKYVLDELNTQGSIASADDVKRVNEINSRRPVPLGEEAKHRPGELPYMPELLDYPDDVYLHGYFQSDKYFNDIEDIIRQEFTLKMPPQGRSAAWLERISNAECAVSLHIRHGDYATNINCYNSMGLVPLDYYYQCIEELKNHYPQMTVFVFSNSLSWTKENLHFDMPMEFVEGCERDLDELFLMSQCKHNIIANSTFSWWGAWLNQNPDKKVFMPSPWFRIGEAGKDVHFPESWIRVPVDYNKNEPILNIEPLLSIILVTNNDEQFVGGCLASLSAQNYRFYEIIVVDNGSTDHSFDIIKQIAAQNDKIVPLKLETYIGMSAARNLALKKARGQYVLFFDVRSVMFSHTVTEICVVNIERKSEVFHSTRHMTENPNGTVDLINRKFEVNIDPAFKDLPYQFSINNINGMDRLNLLISGSIRNVLANNAFRREFLIDNGIFFERSLEGGSDILFLIKCFMIAKNFWVTSVPFQAQFQRKTRGFDWELELNSFICLTRKYLSPIGNEDLRKRFALSLVKQYINEL